MPEPKKPRMYAGCEHVTGGNPGHTVEETRRLRMPDGTVLVCRRRAMTPRKSYWTAEVPIEMAKEIHSE
jgi:hypothetical protein